MRPEELHPFCADLVSKKILCSEGLPRREEDVRDASNHCWCARTSQVVGPDRRPVSPVDCRRGRACFRSALERML